MDSTKPVYASSVSNNGNNVEIVQRSRSSHYSSYSEDEVEKESESHDEYSSATSTNPFILPAATWATPTAEHGQPVVIVLPIVNMFKYDVKDVIITPVVSTKTDEFPFEIDLTGFTQKIPYLLGENAEADPNKRVQNCAWAFRTREDIKTGYYKLDFNITYTNPACVIESCTIATFVRTQGLKKYGSTNGDEAEKKKSTPRVIVRGFTTEPEEVRAGQNFFLHLTMENTSKETAVKNMELDLTGVVAGKDSESSYAAFLPTSGANSFYVDNIPAGGTKELTMEFNVKADLEQKPYVMDIKMLYEDDEANPYEGSANVSIPVHQLSKYDISTPEVQPSNIGIGEQSNVMFSIYNTGKTKLYNVSVSFNGASIEPALCYVGGIESGGTGNVDLMLTGIAPTEDDGTIPFIVSYEDESGKVTSETQELNLYVADNTDFEEEESFDEGSVETGDDNKKNILIAAGTVAGCIIIFIIAGIIARKKKKEREEP
ncbi:MAG: hypothetical protein J6P05_01680 [Lachnospiraceae bacterium]|nr:hypothetical protein [Lachnospiraceae bacterium]